MAVQKSFADELDQLARYIKSDENEDAKRPLLYPLFQKLLKEKFRIGPVVVAKRMLDAVQHVGLENEPYFKYFDYPDFLTPHSGLIQIRKYAEVNQAADLSKRSAEM